MHAIKVVTSVRDKGRDLMTTTTPCIAAMPARRRDVFCLVNTAEGGDDYRASFYSRLAKL
jgi:hypothetical protein